jgi:hypothetical protein
MIDISNGTALEFLIFKLPFVTDVFILTDEVILTRADLQKIGKMGENLGRCLISFCGTRHPLYWGSYIIYRKREE